jgi:hypothetical protein
VLPRPLRLLLAEDHQHLRDIRHTALAPRLHQRPDPCTTTGPFSPARTSTVRHTASGTAAHQSPTRTKGTRRRRPRLVGAGSSALRSRTDVFEGTASR